MPDVEYLNHNVLLLYNNYFIFRATWKFEWMFMENWIIHSSMTFQMKFILKEAIYSLLYRVFHLHLDSAKHLSMTHLSSRCTSMNI